MTWLDQAACRGANTSIWYPDRGEPDTEAKTICNTCPVRAECAEAGMGERYGIWGGNSERQRRAIRNRALKPCGTDAAYRDGCRCEHCRAAHAAYRAARRATVGRAAS